MIFTFHTLCVSIHKIVPNTRKIVLLKRTLFLCNSVFKQSVISETSWTSSTFQEKNKGDV
jgi:hypothetical protein